MTSEPQPGARVDVDTDRCIYTLQCTYHAPDVFDVDEDGQMIYTRQVPPGTEEAVELAAELCPSRAIRLSR